MYLMRFKSFRSIFMNQSFPDRHAIAYPFNEMRITAAIAYLFAKKLLKN